MDIQKQILDVLESGYLMSLGTVDEGGVWVADVLYVHDGMKIYWMSSPKVRHSVAIGKNPQVAGSITVNGPKENNFGIQFQGIARELSDLRPDLITKVYTKRKSPIPTDMNEAMKGRSWYEITLQKADLIDEKNYGFKKQSVSL